MLRNAVAPRQKARQNMLYFSDGTAGANATTEAVCIPSYCIKSMEPISASLMNIYFQELREEQGTTTAVDSPPKYTYVSLSIGDGDFKAVQEVSKNIKDSVYNDLIDYFCELEEYEKCSEIKKIKDSVDNKE